MADPTLKELLAGSSLSFTGTVRAVGETPVAGLEADEHTAVVQVEEALHGPAAVDLDPGTTVTVQLSPDRPPLAVGDRATFFANALVYGDTPPIRPPPRASPTPRTRARPRRSTPRSTSWPRRRCSSTRCRPTRWCAGA
jgi:hypothetical protein